jgi:biotin operon repressor
MTKLELENRINVLEVLVADMLETIDCLDHEPEVMVVEKAGRKDEVLAILKRGAHVSVPQIAKEVGISDRNVSSQMSYLRKDGYKIATDSRGYKFLEA